MVEEETSFEEEIMSPKQVKEKYPAGEIASNVSNYIRQIRKILDGEDERLIVITGPCSISDTEEALEYAEKLKQLSDKVSDKILLVMRTYFEKPRTTLGWKGLLYDPELDESYEIQEGIETTRKLLIEIGKIGVPCGTEFLSSHVPKYIGDLISWAAIGARTSESQGHREFSSRLGMPVGFKNGVNGDVSIAANAMVSAQSPHSYLGVSEEGRYVKVKTKGNMYSHVILRGGREINYDEKSVKSVLEMLRSKNLRDKIMIDCSHGNSGKDHTKEAEVFRNVLKQRVESNKNIVGIMLESHLNSGSQSIDGDLYGVSKTDGCIGWEETESLIMEAYNSL